MDTKIYRGWAGGRKNNSFTYRDERLKELLGIMNYNEYLTTNAITNKYKKINPQTHFMTIKSMLERLHKQGSIKFVKAGKVTLWSK